MSDYTWQSKEIETFTMGVPLYGQPMTFTTLSLSALGSYECFYCGSNLPRNQKQCPSCGARDWQRIRK